MAPEPSGAGGGPEVCAQAGSRGARAPSAASERSFITCRRSPQRRRSLRPRQSLRPHRSPRHRRLRPRRRHQALWRRRLHARPSAQLSWLGVAGRADRELDARGAGATAAERAAVVADQLADGADERGDVADAGAAGSGRCLRRMAHTGRSWLRRRACSRRRCPRRGAAAGPARSPPAGLAHGSAQ